MIEKSLPLDNNKYRSIIIWYAVCLPANKKMIILKEIKNSLKYDSIIAQKKKLLDIPVFLSFLFPFPNVYMYTFISLPPLLHWAISLFAKTFLLIKKIVFDSSVRVLIGKQEKKYFPKQIYTQTKRLSIAPIVYN